MLRLYLGHVAIFLLTLRDVFCTEYYEFTECFDDVGFCLWTDGSTGSFSDAVTFCRQRDNSFLPRVNNAVVQSKLHRFRLNDQANFNLLELSEFWIDVHALTGRHFHWIDGSVFTGDIRNHAGHEQRYAALVHNSDQNRLLYVARKWNDQQTRSYICQTTRIGSSCSPGEFLRNTSNSCYLKVETDSAVTWYSASNDCLSRGGSLAIFSDLGRPSDDLQLMRWLGTSHTFYWIGLVRQWWTSKNKTGDNVDIQYSDWGAGEPSSPINNQDSSVVMTRANDWKTVHRDTTHRIVCQNYGGRKTTTTESGPVFAALQDNELTTPFVQHNYCKSLEVAVGTSIGLGFGVGIPTFLIVAIAAKVYEYKTREKRMEEVRAAAAEARANKSRFGNRRNQQR